MTIKRVDHIAIVVDSIDEARAFYEDALGLTIEHTEQIDEQEVKVAFLPIGETEIELLEPTNDSSGVAKFLSKRGGGIHHIALEVDSVQEMIDRLKMKGIALLNEEPAVGAGGNLVAFIHPRSAYGVLIEFYQKPD